MTGGGLRRVVALAGCLVAAFFAPGAAAAAPPAAPDPAAVDRYLADSREATRIPGMAVAIVRGGEVVHVAGYGTDGRGAPVTPRTPFRVGSLTKAFTAAAVLQLVDAGRVDLDAPVRAYLPGVDVSGRITVRHLLNQTSGLADPAVPSLDDAGQDLAQRVASLRDARLVSEPGREFHYTDANYQVLARLVEVVSGVPWAGYLAERVFAPLDLAGTAAGATAAQADAPPGHVLPFGVPVARPELDGLLAGSGGVVSTAEDLGRWLVAQTGGGGPVLAPEAVALMQTPPPGVVGGYAMGWQRVAPERLEHTGVLSTYSAIQVLLPEDDLAFVLLFNGYRASADTAGVAAGLAALLTGDAQASGPRSTALVAAVLGGATLAVLALRARQLLRVPRWRHRRAGRSRWRALPGLAWLVLPVALLAGVPALLTAAIGRSFTFWQLCLAMPDVLVLVAVWALSGTVLAGARIVALVRG
ncbi:MAG TPA: serine hydrolase domain-containing protein [Pseudonocardia sp.]|nr:serine hydrolase domain-containing protein [Pseudonocardia sp.]